MVNHLEPSLRYPAFDSLMGGAFNQDWRDEWSSVDEVLAEALDDFLATRNVLLPELLEIRANCTEADVVDLLESMGSGFDRKPMYTQVLSGGWSTSSGASLISTRLTHDQSLIRAGSPRWSTSGIMPGVTSTDRSGSAAE